MDNKTIHENKLPEKTYISKAFPQYRTYPDFKGGSEEKCVGNIRIISKVVDSQETYSFAQIKQELILRRTDKGRQEIKATIWEETRDITVLTLQRYTMPSGKPHECSFSFVGEEIEVLIEFINSLEYLTINDGGHHSLLDGERAGQKISAESAKEFILGHQDLLTHLMATEVTKEDIIALGYRKRQLEVFKLMLQEKEYFEDLRVRKKTTAEGLWQKFFEKNTWIFGYGLSFVFNSSLDEKKLEQIVAGTDFNSSGKRIDALLKTKGIIESFCFAEIKTHQTALLKTVAKGYRTESWQVSDELSGAIAQVQRTVHKSVSNIATQTEMKDSTGNPTGEKVFLYTPKAYIIIGSMSEFETEHGINEDKYSSFELFRQALHNIEVISFDELYERAKHIVRHNEQSH